MAFPRDYCTGTNFCISHSYCSALQTFAFLSICLIFVQKKRKKIGSCAEAKTYCALKVRFLPKFVTAQIVGSIRGIREYSEQEDFRQTSAKEERWTETDRLIKELASALLSRQTRADTRFTRGISAVDLSFSAAHRANTTRPLFTTTMTNVTTIHGYTCPGLSAAVAAITRDVVFMKRDKNSKRDPINRVTRPRGNARPPRFTVTHRRARGLPDENGRKQGWNGTGRIRRIFLHHARLYFNAERKKRDVLIRWCSEKWTFLRLKNY